MYVERVRLAHLLHTDLSVMTLFHVEYLVARALIWARVFIFSFFQFNPFSPSKMPTHSSSAPKSPLPMPLPMGPTTPGSTESNAGECPAFIRTGR